MARITVEDCLDNVDNRFELVLLATKRARNLANRGATPKVPEDNDKPTVIALREIASGLIDSNTVDKQDVSVSDESEHVEEEQIIEFSPRPTPKTESE